MLFAVRIIFSLLLFDNLIIIMCLIQLKSDKLLASNMESYITDMIRTIFAQLKVNINEKINSYTQLYSSIAIANRDDKVILEEIIKETRVETKNINGSFIDIINEVLDGNVRDSEAKNETASESFRFEDVGQFITEFKDLKNDLFMESYNYGLDDKLLKCFNYSTSHNISNIAMESNEDFSDIEFWKPVEQSGRRIYRGDRTKIKYFPFMASVLFFNKFQCGGSIIKSDLIISAASCLQLAWNNRFFRENPSFLSVRIGSNYYATGGEHIPVLEVYFHPAYNPRNLRNNLCMMRLVRRIRFRRRGRRVKKIDIDRNASPLPETTDGVTIVGWGAKGSSNIVGNLWTNRLSFSVLDYYPLQECREVYSSEYVTRKNFCAGFFSKGGGACNRDVGGPGVVNGRLAGVISFGSPVCGAPNAPTVFTKIGYYADWIDEILDQRIPNSKKRTTLKPPLHTFRPPFLHTSPKPTTFNMEPLGGGVMKPMPISDTDPLRVFSDDSLFNDFLNTVITNQQNLVRHQKDIKTENEILHPTVTKTNTVFTEDVPDISHLKTVMDYEEFTTKATQKFTAINDDFDANNEIELQKDLAKLMDDIDLIQIVNSDSGDSDEEEFKVTSKLTTVKKKKRKAEAVSKKEKRKKLEEKLHDADDPVLTLLYLTDNEKKNGGLEDLEHRGLSIPMDSFKDLTHRNNETDLFDFIPKDELYDLLSDAVIENNNKKAKN